MIMIEFAKSELYFFGPFLVKKNGKKFQIFTNRTRIGSGTLYTIILSK